MTQRNRIGLTVPPATRGQFMQGTGLPVEEPEDFNDRQANGEELLYTETVSAGSAAIVGFGKRSTWTCEWNFRMGAGTYCSIGLAAGIGPFNTKTKIGSDESSAYRTMKLVKVKPAVQR